LAVSRGLLERSCEWLAGDVRAGSLSCDTCHPSHTHSRTHTRTHIHTHIHTHRHTLTHTHTHTHTHTKTHEDKWEAARRVCDTDFLLCVSVLICVCVDTCQLIQISCYVSLCDSLDMRHTSRSNVFDTHAYSHVLDTSSIPMPIHMQLHPHCPQSLFRLRCMWGNLLFESQGNRMRAHTRAQVKGGSPCTQC